ncbi:RlpA-like double-psi beta-barrel-protein domain-containing protein-containing protein [Spinellus fusiger]|nr:RlpA-like double-psi beta-barrel-protein domain-containing protein-containing protein [Spinellus fusiger]KAI7864766.1 RlpA-like double-psi beta-barrel-protein domain-containing protein-containing protein [Spinellus fusiger]
MYAIVRFASFFLLASAAQIASASDAEKRGNIYGDATYYNPGVGLGSCGQLHHDSELIVAINWQQMANGANPNNNSKCNKYINVWGPKGYVRAKITDTCPGCKWGAIDLSPVAFDRIANRDQGRVKVWWNWA